ncbi:MAG: tetratricopeptide repeat protein [SAR324 cluster bacterium]|nr:tetratricopeptide repeat protein [SAR324 cluster bacterium]
MVFWNGCSSNPEIQLSALHHFEKGNTAYEQMNYQEAIASYHRAIEMDDQTAEYHYNMGLSYYAVGKYQHALIAFENATRLAPKMAESYYNVALVYNKLYEAEKAHKFYSIYQELMSERKKQAPLPKAVPSPPQNVPKQSTKPSAQQKRNAGKTAKAEAGKISKSVSNTIPKGQKRKLSKK